MVTLCLNMFQPWIVLPDDLMICNELNLYYQLLDNYVLWHGQFIFISYPTHKTGEQCLHTVAKNNHKQTNKQTKNKQSISCHFADNRFRWLFHEWKFACIIQISLTFVAKDPTDNK